MGTVDRVIAVVSDKLDVPADEISADSRFVDDLNADSLDQVELIMALEDEYDLTIPDEDAQKILTITDAVSYIEEHA
ncbi:MAG: acyl carrier protein [Chloroflexota bacterium]|nr:acyl carrier protein [bacterium]MDE2768682.1 acyl carrier protein [Chloroflexota bacterium]MDE2867569.1 acyl carrier protein [Chloroflexota bacterium]MDE2897785.1 acyl carrier protein [Chloroflexota bacterium]MDE2920304.1 acyl carrier protein [Chloroflexota bacterium]